MSIPHSYLAMTKPSPYSESEARPEICTSERRYCIVYPLDKKREWYRLPLEERRRVMAEHIEIGRRYPEITINTAYSFGLDDQEFVVSFECDDPGEFLDLVQELRDLGVERLHAARHPDLHLRRDVDGAGARRARRHRGRTRRASAPRTGRRRRESTKPCPLRVLTHLIALACLHLKRRLDLLAVASTVVGSSACRRRRRSRRALRRRDAVAVVDLAVGGCGGGGHCACGCRSGRPGRQ